MTEELREWLDKADGDFETAQRESRVTVRPNHDAVLFHGQQCIEKLMKGTLIFRHMTPPHIHDLVELSQMLTAVEPSWRADEAELKWLSMGAVHSRYPIFSTSQADAARAVEITSRLRDRLLPLLQSPPPAAPPSTP